MLRMVFEAFVYVMALYGFITIVENMIDSLAKKARVNKTSYKLVLSVKNQQESIEGVIREIFGDELFNDKNLNTRVIVIDKGSTDETVKILRKLQEDYENLEVIEEEEQEYRI